jgi:hypothetical protein
MTPEEWKKFSGGLQAEAPDTPSGGDEPYAPPIQGTLNFGRGLVEGAKKGVASMIPESIEGKSWKDYSSSEGDPQSVAERAGEWTGDIGANIAPFFINPPLGIATKVGELGNLAARFGPRAATFAGKWAPRLGRYIEGTVKGTAAGGIESAVHNEEDKTPEEFGRNVKRGAVTGGTATAGVLGTRAAARLAYEALPPGLKHMLGMGALTSTVAGAGLAVIDRLGNHHWIPWHLLYGAAAPVAAGVAGVAGAPPGVIGAGAERAAQGAGYERTDKPQPQQEGSGDYVEAPK